jgi:hypothetical protein
MTVMVDDLFCGAGDAPPHNHGQGGHGGRGARSLASGPCS